MNDRQTNAPQPPENTRERMDDRPPNDNTDLDTETLAVEDTALQTGDAAGIDDV